MFNMSEVGKKIALRRKEIDMTQMELADRMGVTHQAVSSWEKGTTMPDIGKLEDLSKILDISIDKLLGNNRNSKIVEEIIEKDVDVKEVDLKDLAQIAPILKPKQIEEAYNTNKKEEIDIDNLLLLAPYLDEDDVDELLENISSDLSIDQLTAICPFATEKGIGKVASKLKVNGLGSLVPIAPFMDEDDLGQLVLNSFNESDTIDGIVPLAPFIDEDILGEIALKVAAKKGIKSLIPLIPFLDEDVIKKMYKKM